MNTTNINLQEITRLPLKVINVADKSLPDVFIETPMGQKRVKLKEEHYALFGSPSQMERHAPEVMFEIHQIEEESKDYLLSRWLKEVI